VLTNIISAIFEFNKKRYYRSITSIKANNVRTQRSDDLSAGSG